MSVVRGEDRFVVGDGVQTNVGCNVYLGVAEVGTFQGCRLTTYDKCRFLHIIILCIVLGQIR